MLIPKVAEIKSAENEQVELANQMYLIQEKSIADILNFKWMDKKSQLVLIGGISVNFEGDTPNRFLPLMFSIKTKFQT